MLIKKKSNIILEKNKKLWFNKIIPKFKNTKSMDSQDIGYLRGKMQTKLPTPRYL